MAREFHGETLARLARLLVVIDGIGIMLLCSFVDQWGFSQCYSSWGLLRPTPSIAAPPPLEVFVLPQAHDLIRFLLSLEAQSKPQLAQERAKIGPSWSQDGSKIVQESTKMAKLEPKCLQDG